MGNSHNEVLGYLLAHIDKPMENYPSKLGQWLGGVVRKAERGFITVEYVVRDEMTNAAKTLHGGSIAAILDDLMGLAVASLGSEYFFATINLAVDYLSGAQEGDLITVNVRVLREGKNICNVEAVMTNTQGKLLAKATSNLSKTAIQQTKYQG